MPTTIDDLEEARKRNLAREDAGISAVNAVNRMRSALPGIGGSGSTPTTDQTNLNIASSMERADLGSRFGFASPEYVQNTETPAIAPVQDNGGIDIAAVNERRNQILGGVDPDAPARYISDRPGRGGISRRDQLQHELGTLTAIAHQHALESAQGAHEDFVTQRHIDTANQVAGFFTDLGASKTQLGTPEHTQEVAGLAAKYPLALGTAGVRDTLKTHMASHVAASNFVAPEGTELARVVQSSDGKSHAIFTPIPEVTTYPSKDKLLAENPNARPKQNAKGGWYDSGDKAATDADKALETEAKKTYDIPLSQIRKPLAVRSGNLDEDGKFTPAVGGTHFQVDVLDKGKAGSVKSVTIPRDDFARYGGGMSEADKTIIPKGGGAATPDEIRAQYKVGKLTKEQATELLRKGHGFE